MVLVICNKVSRVRHKLPEQMEMVRTHSDVRYKT